VKMYRSSGIDVHATRSAGTVKYWVEWDDFGYHGHFAHSRVLTWYRWLRSSDYKLWSYAYILFSYELILQHSV
jgi:hypothetical protein